MGWTLGEQKEAYDGAGNGKNIKSKRHRTGRSQRLSH